jgi:glycerol-3-phosphate dehydrogenase (NAD(P)+)
VVGVEVGGALKNVIAIATGIAEGCGYGINSQSALLTRALSEISRFGIAHGAQRETFMGLSGMGDLILTCLGNLSRNKQLGIAIGKGQRAEDYLRTSKTVAEGYYTARAVAEIIKKMKLDLPMLMSIYEVLFLDKKPKEALKELMLRPTKWE